MVFRHSFITFLRDYGNYKKITGIREKHFAEADEKIPEESFPVNEQAARLHPGKQIMLFERAEDFYGEGMAVYLRKAEGKAAFFRPGQCSSVTVEYKGKPIRSNLYFISDPADAEDGIYTFFVSGRDKAFTGFFTENRRGDTIEVGEPMGYSYYQPLRDGENVAVIADCTGLGGAAALVRHLRSRNINPTAFCTDKVNGTAGFKYGDIEHESLLNTAKSVFVFGTNELSEKVKTLFPGVNVRTARTDLPYRTDESEREKYLCRVFRNGNTYEVECDAGRTVLSSLEQAGIGVNIKCCSGECGACRCRLISGNVSFAYGDTRRLAEKKNGYIYTCVSFPESDITVEF